MPRAWNHRLQKAAVSLGVKDLVRKLNEPLVAILAYHNIIPTGETVAGDQSLHVDQQTFADQLDLISETHEVVPLAQIHHTSGSSARVAITFDDAYVGCLTAGLEELRKRGLPSTVFVPPGLLGADGFWWDRLAPKGGGPLKDEIREYCLNELQGRHDSILGWAATQGLACQTMPDHARPADEGTLLLAARDELVSLGAHTWSHPNLAVLDHSECVDELARSEDWLRSRAPTFVDWVAYPYGRYVRSMRDTAAEHFSGGLLIDRGLAMRRGGWSAPTPLETRRIVVPRGRTLDALSLHMAGLGQSRSSAM